MKLCLMILPGLVILFSGCTTGQYIQQFDNQFLCPDGSQVSSPDFCKDIQLEDFNIQIKDFYFSNEHLCQYCLDSGRFCNQIMTTEIELISLGQYKIDRLGCTNFFDGEEITHSYLFLSDNFAIRSTPKYLDMTMGRDNVLCCSVRYSIRDQYTGETITKYTDEVCKQYYVPPVCAEPEPSGCGCGK